MDIDVQAKVKGSHLEKLLTQKGFIKTTDKGEKFKENKFYIGSKGVFNISYHGKEIQILPVGDTRLDELTQAADLNLNCVAYSLEKKDFLNKRFIPDLFKKRLSFVDYEKVDLSKVLSALKFLSRNLFDILAKLNLHIGGLWATIHESSAKMAVLIERKSNIRIIDNKKEMIELLVAKYPSYSEDDFIIEINSDGHLVFSRKDKDYKQLLLVSS